MPCSCDYVSHDGCVNVVVQYFKAFRTLPICAVLGAMTSSIWAADPVVSNVKGLQRPGTKLVDITYDVTADTPTVWIAPETSKYGELVEGKATVRASKNNCFSQKAQMLSMLQ